MIALLEVDFDKRGRPVACLTSPDGQLFLPFWPPIPPQEGSARAEGPKAVLPDNGRPGQAEAPPCR